MKDPKNEAASFINRAKEELEQALAHLDHIPAFDPGAVHFAAHALGNNLTISRLVTDLLLSALKEHPDPKIGTWLEGLHHATGLMNKTVKRLLDESSSDAPPFVKDKVDMRIMIGRARDHYQNIARPKDIRIMFMPPSEPAKGSHIVTFSLDYAWKVTSLLFEHLFSSFTNRSYITKLIDFRR